jgi:aryl-phospho-beta-D-glucosidase BglC (GH1 family)
MADKSKGLVLLLACMGQSCVGLWNSIGMAAVKLTGVSLAGTKFGERNLPGVYKVDYRHPTVAEFDYFVSKGISTFRLPFRWERLQRKLGAPFDPIELAWLDRFVIYATNHGAYVILDPHNYARYREEIIGSARVPLTAFSDFWSRSAVKYNAPQHKGWNG